MRLDFDYESPDRFVEFSWDGVEYRVPRIKTLSTFEVRNVIESCGEDGNGNVAKALVDLCLEKGGFFGDIDSMPQDLQIALIKAIGGEDAKK